MPMGHTMLQYQDIYTYINIRAYRLHIEARSTAKGAEVEGMCASSSSAFRRVMNGTQFCICAAPQYAAPAWRKGGDAVG